MNENLRALVRASTLELLQRAQERVSYEECARALGISQAALVRLIRLGVVEPAGPGTRELTAATVYRLARLLRLQRDLEVDEIGAAIIVDLLERMETLEREIVRLRT